MLEVKFYDTVDDSLLKFAVIISQSNGKWVFCKHKERDTYEAPGGHREVGEDILETAKRELQEETGAIQFDIKPICVYSVTGKNSVNETGEETFGLLCFAEITEFAGKLESEIEKVELMNELPESWTYPMIQPKLIEKYMQIEMQSYSRIQLAAKQTIEYIKNTIKPGMNLLEIRKLCEEKLLELGADSFWYWRASCTAGWSLYGPKTESTSYAYCGTLQRLYSSAPDSRQTVAISSTHSSKCAGIGLWAKEVSAERRAQRRTVNVFFILSRV